MALAVLVLLLAVPCSAAAELTAQAVRGDSGTVAAESATVMVRPSESATGVQGNLLYGSWELVDEVRENSVRYPGAPASFVNVESKRHVTHGILESGSLSISPTDEDAVVLVLGDDFATEAIASGFTIHAVPSALLEESHVRSEQTLGEPSPFVYYRYDVEDVLGWAPTSNASLIISGTFQVYVWGATVTFRTGDGAQVELRTGRSIESREDTMQLTDDDHQRYLVLGMQGNLRVDGPSSSLGLYGSSFSTGLTGSIEFSGTEGRVSGRGGSFETRGGVTAAQGSYVLSYQDGIIGVQVTEPPASVVGPQVTYVPDPIHQRPWFAPTLLGAILLVCVLAASYGYPSMRGLLHLKTMEDLTGRPRPRGWAKVRAEGFAMMAAAAEEAGHSRRAALWMVLACRLDPHDAEKTLDAGIFLHAAGRSRRALELHNAAHGAFVEAGDVDNIAHNAYEAAKLVAEHGSPEQALDWLRIALQADPALVYEVGSDPRFYRLRDQPDYASLTSAGAA